MHEPSNKTWILITSFWAVWTSANQSGAAQKILRYIFKEQKNIGDLLCDGPVFCFRCLLCNYLMPLQYTSFVFWGGGGGEKNNF